MNSVTTGAILRTLRKEADLSAQDVSAILRYKYSIKLSSRTLFRYEAGCSIPNITHFLALCTIYHCHDILYTFGYRDEKSVPSGLNFEERQIINNYRNLPIIEKNIILGALEIKKERPTQRIALLNAEKILFKLILQKHNTLGHCVLKPLVNHEYSPQFILILLPLILIINNSQGRKALSVPSALAI